MESQRQKNPFWESTPFWGFASLAATIVFTVIGVRMKNLSWLFIVAWTCGIPASAIVFKGITARTLKYLVTLALLIGLAAFLYLLDRETKPKDDRTQISILWNSPQPIDAGTPLSSRELNATTAVEGAFVYNPALGATLPVGTDTLSVDFIPKDGIYTSQTKTVTITVKPLAVEAKQSREVPTRGDLIADFINPDDLELVISNVSDATANQPTFGTSLVDLDDIEAGILPIGRATGDFLRGRASLLRIPLLHYGTNSVLAIVKPGHRIVGYMSLTCADCQRIRWYWIYYEYGKQGWFAESKTEPSFRNLHLSLANLANGTESIDKFVPKIGRHKILPVNGVVRFPEQGTLR